MSNGAQRLIIVALLLLVAVLAIRACSKKAIVNTELEEVVVQREDSLQHYKDEAGREHGMRMITIAGEDVIKAFYKGQIDSLTSQLKIRDNQIASFQTIGTKTTGTIDVPIRRDTITGTTSFSYNDPWLSFNGDISDMARVDYLVRDSLTFTTYWKRKWLFGKKTYYIDAFSQNPRVAITGLSGVQISVKDPGRFSLGPYIGYGWNGTQWAPNIGIGLHYSLIRF